MDLSSFDIKKLNGMLLKKEIKPIEILHYVLKRIEKVEGHIKAYITLTEEEAEKTAWLQKRLSWKERQLL